MLIRGFRKILEKTPREFRRNFSSTAIVCREKERLYDNSNQIIRPPRILITGQFIFYNKSTNLIVLNLKLLQLKFCMKLFEKVSFNLTFNL